MDRKKHENRQGRGHRKVGGGGAETRDQAEHVGHEHENPEGCDEGEHQRRLSRNHRIDGVLHDENEAFKNCLQAFGLVREGPGGEKGEQEKAGHNHPGHDHASGDLKSPDRDERAFEGACGQHRHSFRKKYTLTAPTASPANMSVIVQLKE